MKKILICIISLICSLGMTFLAACKNGPKTNAEGHLIASNGYRIPNVPEEPVLIGNVATSRVTEVSNIGSVFMFSGKEIGDMDIALLQNNFYYSATISEVENEIDDWSSTSSGYSGIESFTDRLSMEEMSRLELFMEYNGVDWLELSDMYYEEGGVENFLAELNTWWQRFNEIRDEVPEIYIYHIKLYCETEETYEAVTQDAAKALEDGIISQSEYENYISGRLKYYAPSQNGNSAVTQAELNIDGEKHIYDIGYIAYKDVFGERFATDETFSGYVYNGLAEGTDKAFGANTGNDVLFGEDGKSFTLSFDVMYVFGEQNAAEREYGELTLENLELVTESIPGASVQSIAIKYISPLGVEATAAWDGENDITIPVRNQMQGEDSCRFSIQMTFACDEAVPYDADWGLYGFLSADIDGQTKTVFCASTGFGWPVARIVSLYGRAYYAFAYEGVDIYSMANAIDFSTIGYNSPQNYLQSDFSGFIDDAFYGEESPFWQEYVVENSYPW